MPFHLHLVRRSRISGGKLFFRPCFHDVYRDSLIFFLQRKAWNVFYSSKFVSKINVYVSKLRAAKSNAHLCLTDELDTFPSQQINSLLSVERIVKAKITHGHLLERTFKCYRERKLCK
jgi:hypothetical protein